MRWQFICGGMALLAAASGHGPASGATATGHGSGYHLVKKVPLAGNDGWDYLTLDAPSHRLFIAHGTHVLVIDVDRDEQVGDIPDTPGVHGVALAPALNRGFTSNGRADTATIFDRHTLRTVGHVTTGNNPDAILYDPVSRRVFTMNGRSDDITALAAADGSVAGTIALGGRPEFAVTDGTGRVYVNLEDRSEVVALDARSLRVVHRWPLAPCEEPTGLAIDATHGRLFAGCHNRTMAVVDTGSGRVVATIPIGEGVDATRFDAGTGLIFASCGDGTLTVAHEDAPDTYTVVDVVTTQRGARTMELDPVTHRIYLVAADYAAAPAADAPRPPIVPNSFVLLVYGR